MMSFSFKRAAIPFCLPIIVDALFEPNPTHLSKSSFQSFMLLVYILNIMHVFFLICNNPRKIQGAKSSSTKLAKITRWPVTDIFVDSSIIIPKNLESRTLSYIFHLTIDEMQTKILLQFFFIMINFLCHISFNLYKQITQIQNIMKENDFFPYIIRCLEQRMHGFIACSIHLCNTFFHCSLSILHCPSQAPILCILPMVLKGWYSNVNVV